MSSDSITMQDAVTVRTSIGWPTLLALLGCSSILSLLCGAVAAWYVVMSTPIPPSIAIVDSDALLRQSIALDPSNPKAAADRVLLQTRARVANLVSQGIVVLDRSAVIDAPAAIIVRADVDAPLQSPELAEPAKRKTALELLRGKATP